MNYLPNYIRSFRQKAHLTQREVAFLHGSKNGTTVLRHEQYQKVPQLTSALIYSAIFSKSVSEIFSGEYEQVEQQVRKRAKQLLKEYTDGDDPHKIYFLKGLADPNELYLIPCDSNEY